MGQLTTSLVFTCKIVLLSDGLTYSVLIDDHLVHVLNTNSRYAYTPALFHLFGFLTDYLRKTPIGVQMETDGLGGYN
jgi:hypothetical protein